MIRSILVYIKYRRVKFKSTGEDSKYKSLSSLFLDPINISIGTNVHIGPNAMLEGTGGITIEKNTIIAPNVTIRTRNHYYDGNDLRALPFDNRIVLKSVLIEKNVWIGSNVIIVPGVTIGEGAIVATGSVVTKNIPKMAVVGGNPAKVIKYRNERKYNELNEKNAFVYEMFGHRKVLLNEND